VGIYRLSRACCNNRQLTRPLRRAALVIFPGRLGHQGETPLPPRFTLANTTQSQTAQGATESLQGRTPIRCEAFVAPRAAAGNFFRIVRLLMALAGLGRRLGRFLPPTHTLSVTARLLTAKLLAPLAGPIALGRQPP